MRAHLCANTLPKKWNSTEHYTGHVPLPHYLPIVLDFGVIYSMALLPALPDALDFFFYF